MRVGWRQYIKQRFKRASDFYSVGIEFASEELRVSVLREDNHQLTWVKQHVLPINDWQQELAALVKTESLTNTPCHLVFAPSKYPLLQVDRPSVKDEEISQALTWSLKDTVAIDDELVVDYFDLPVQSAGANKINAVAFAKAEIQTIAEVMYKADLILQSIGIAELAMCQLVEDSDDAVLTLVQQPGQEVCLNIVKRGNLYFSRRLRGYENLATFTEQELELGVGDNLSVEIQRSMDYFESQLRQAPVKRIYLAMDTSQNAKLADIMQRLTFMPVEMLSPEIAKQPGLEFDCSSYVSVAAALAQSHEGKEQ